MKREDILAMKAALVADDWFVGLLNQKGREKGRKLNFREFNIEHYTVFAEYMGTTHGNLSKKDKEIIRSAARRRWEWLIQESGVDEWTNAPETDTTQ